MTGAFVMLGCGVILALATCFADALAGFAIYCARKVMERRP